MAGRPIYLLTFLMCSPRPEVGTLAGYMFYRTEQELREMCAGNNDCIAQQHAGPHIKSHLYDL